MESRTPFEETGFQVEKNRFSARTLGMTPMCSMREEVTQIRLIDFAQEQETSAVRLDADWML